MTELLNLSFENQKVRAIESDGETWWVAKDVCDILGILTEQTRRLDEDEKGLRLIQTPSGNQEMVIVNESGLYCLVLGSRKPEAKAFKRWVTHDVLPSIRKTGVYLTPEKQVEQLQDENQRIRLKLQVFEEYQSDELVGYDEAAAMLAVYRKPPFGVKHFKTWMADKGILTKQHCKNDKPIQCYIDKGWFRCVAHEYFRNGRRRYENRYLLTWRGVNNLIDLAITDKLVVLPAPQQECLPYHVEDTRPHHHQIDF